MRGVPLRDVRGKYLYHRGYHGGAPGYISYNFYLDGRKGPQGEVWRKHRNDRKWYARHRNYPGEEDFATGRTRDEAVDKLLSLVGEG